MDAPGKVKVQQSELALYARVYKVHMRDYWWEQKKILIVLRMLL